MKAFNWQTQDKECWSPSHHGIYHDSRETGMALEQMVRTSILSNMQGALVHTDCPNALPFQVYIIQWLYFLIFQINILGKGLEKWINKDVVNFINVVK